MPLIAGIFRIIFAIAGAIPIIVKSIHYIWKFIKKISLNPNTWFILGLAPLWSLLIELFTGKPTIVSQIINNMVTSMLNIIMESLEKYGEIDIQQYISMIPEKVMEICCYLGVIEALQLLFDKIVLGMAIIFMMKINLFLARIKVKAITDIPKKWR